MTSPRDDIDKWLGGEVTPLYPRAGSLQRIQGRAKKRKRRQALMTAAGCAVVLAAAVTVPQLVSAGQQPGGHGRQPLAIIPTAPSVQPTSLPVHDTVSGTIEGHGTQVHQHTYLTTRSSGTVPPAHFRPTSVTVVGAGTATQPKLVGAVIGQAGPPCYNPGNCTSMAGTASYGSRWYGVSAPVAGSPDGATGVSQLRFTNLRDGWAFGPALFETSGGGWPWTPVVTAGQRVTDLEAAGQSAVAIFARCTGSGADYASHCTSFSLRRSEAGSTTWTAVAVPATFRSMSTSQPSSASLVISSGTTGYLLSPSGAVLTGPVSGGAWTDAGQAPCQPGAAQPTGSPPAPSLPLALSCCLRATLSRLAAPTRPPCGCRRTARTGPGRGRRRTRVRPPRWRRRPAAR